MNITVFLGANPGIKKEYEEVTREIGRKIGERSHTLVYGGSSTGLMGALCDSALEAGAKVIGVEPDVPLIRRLIHPGLTEAIMTDSMQERRNVMTKLGDAFVVMPGGIGTLAELSDVIEKYKLGIKRARIAFVNTFGYYEPVREMFAVFKNEGFYDDFPFDDILFSDDVDEIMDFLES